VRVKGVRIGRHCRCEARGRALGIAVEATPAVLGKSVRVCRGILGPQPRRGGEGPFEGDDGFSRSVAGEGRLGTVDIC